MIINHIELGCIQAFITIIFFYIEALLHYNIGKSGNLCCYIPKFKDNLKIIGIITIFATLSSIMTYLINNKLSKKEKD